MRDLHPLVVRHPLVIRHKLSKHSTIISRGHGTVSLSEPHTYHTAVQNPPDIYNYYGSYGYAH